MELRGAIVEDLQLPPPVQIYTDLSLPDARDLVIDRWPEAPPVVGVLSRANRLVGYLESLQLESDLADDPSQRLADHVHHLSPPHRVAISAPVESLIQALQQAPIVEITDSDNKFMLATATVNDLLRRNIKFD